MVRLPFSLADERMFVQPAGNPLLLWHLLQFALRREIGHWSYLYWTLVQYR